MNIKNIVEQFYEYSLHIRGYSKATIRRYKFGIEYYFKISGVTDLTDATKESIQNFFYYGRSSRKWSVNTVLAIHKSLLVFFRWCFDRGLISFNPMVGIDKPRPEYKLPSKLSKDDSLRLLDSIDNYPYGDQFLRFRNHAIFAVFIFCGLRKGELLNLRYGDIDLGSMTVFVRQGKGKKDRIIPISPTLAHSLRRYLEARKSKNKTFLNFLLHLHKIEEYQIKH
jgi:integrase